MRSSPLSTVLSATALTRHAPTAAFACWLLAAFAVLALSGLTAGDPIANLLTGTLQFRARLAAVVVELIAASWLFLGLFGHKQLGSGLKTAIKLVTHVGIVLLGLIVGAPPQLLPWIASLGAVACAVALALGCARIIRPCGSNTMPVTSLPEGRSATSSSQRAAPKLPSALMRTDQTCAATA